MAETKADNTQQMPDVVPNERYMVSTLYDLYQEWLRAGKPMRQSAQQAPA